MSQTKTISLSPVERRLIAIALTSPDVDIVQLAKLVRSKPHVVRYARDRLRELGVLHPLPLIDSRLLGWQEVALFVSSAGASPAARASFLKFLTGHHAVRVVTEVGGRYQYLVEFLARSVSDAAEFMEALSKASQGSLNERALTFRLSRRYYGRRYLVAGESLEKKVPELTLGGLSGAHELDDRDRQLLTLLSSNPLASAREISRMTGLPHSTVSNRLRSLKERKILLGIIDGVVWEKLMLYGYRVLISLRDIDTVVCRRMWDFFAQHRNVVMAFYGLGAWEVELRVELERPQEMPSFIDQLHSNCGEKIRAVEIVPSFGNQKVDYAPFLA